MKTHRLILFFCFSLVFFTEQVFAADFPGSKTVVAYVQPNQGNSYYAYGTFGIDIGYKYVSEAGASEKARTKFTFDLTTIPPNAEITSVQLSYYAYNYANNSYKLKLTQIGNYNSPQEIWQNIGQASSLFTDVAYASGSLNSGTLTSMVNSSKGSYLYIGALSQNEINTDSRANLDLTLNVQYSVPPATVNITADNNFTASGGTNHGTMVIDSVNRTIPLTGYTFQKNVGQTLTLSANSPQNDNQGHQRKWHTGSINRSVWDRNGDFKSYDQTYPFTVAADDNGKKYTANLRKNFKIDQTHKTEFDGYQPGPTSYIVEQNSGQIQAPGTLPGTYYNFAGWEDNLSATNPRTIWPTNNENYTALYKYTNHSSNSSAYLSNSQRKVVRTDYNGYLHKVYESMGFVWYEVSTDNGTNWSIKNNGKPLSTSESKLPSMDVYSNVVVIVFQEKTTYDVFRIRLAHFNCWGDQLGTTQDVEDELNEPSADLYRINAAPVVAYGVNGRLMVAWYEENGWGGTGEIYYRFGTLTDVNGNVAWHMEYGYGIAGTNISSIIPTIAIRKDAGTAIFHLAWQQGASSVNYCSLTEGLNYSITVSPVEYVSSGNGYTYNQNPYITVVGDYPRLVWIGKRYIGNWDIRVVRRNKTSSGWTSSFQLFGSNTESPTIQGNLDIIAWSENSGSANKFFRWGSIKSFGTLGRDIQLYNAPEVNSMRAIGFRLLNPYYFYTTPTVGSIPKENSIVNRSGREGIIKKGDAEFYFLVGDIFADGAEVKFILVNDSTQISNCNELNQLLITDGFNVNDNSDLKFSVAYGTIDSLVAFNSLDVDDQLNFKVELFDKISGQLLGEYSSVAYSKSEIILFESIAYQINCSGIGNKVVALRLSVAINFESEYYLADVKSDNEIIGKENFVNLSFSGSLAVNEYNLGQNYPNPFNPTTIIKYQIPKAGNVTIRVYDILGSEVATLVDEFKETGKYQVDFDASLLASGIYIYRLSVNDFVNVKKMVLLK